METTTAGRCRKRSRFGVGAAVMALGLGAVGIGVGASAPPAAAAAASPPRAAVTHVATGSVVTNSVVTSSVTAYDGELFSYSPGVATPGGVGSWQLVSPVTTLPPGLRARVVGATVVISGVPLAIGSSVVELRYDAGGVEGIERVAIDVRGQASGWAKSYFSLVTAPASLATLAVPGSVDWSVPADAATLGNSSYNDCVVAAGYHLLAGQAAGVGVTLAAPTEAMAMATYHQLLGGPVTTSAGGVDEESMLSLESARGLDGMHAIAASSLETGSRAELEAAVDELGGVLASIKGAPVKTSTRVWTTSLASEQISHEIAVVGYDAFGPLLATWGRQVRASWAWWDANVASVTAVIPSAFVAVGHGPSGVAVATLLARFGGQFSAPRIEAAGNAVTHVGQYLTDVMAPVGYPIATATVAGSPPAGITASPYGYGTELTGTAKASGVGTHELEMTVTSPIGVAVLGLELTVVSSLAPTSTPSGSRSLPPYVEYIPAGQSYSSEWGVDGAHSYIVHGLPSGMVAATKGAWADITGVPRVGGQRVVTVVDGFGGGVPGGAPLLGLEIVSVVTGVLAFS